jgi:hypothetical protein
MRSGTQKKNTVDDKKAPSAVAATGRAEREIPPVVVPWRCRTMPTATGHRLARTAAFTAMADTTAPISKME